MTRTRSGVTLVEILVAMTLLGLLGAAFTLFMKNSAKPTANLAKIAEATAIDANIRALLAYPAACLETMKHIPSFTVTTEQRPVDIYGWSTTSAPSPKVFEEGKIYSTTKVTELAATVSEDVRNVRLVRIRVKTEKQGESLNRNTYDYDYYINVFMVAGVPNRCVNEEGQGKLTLDKAEERTLLASSQAVVAPAQYVRVSISVPSGSTHFGAPDWEPISLPAAASNCTYEGPPKCPFHLAPAQTFRAEGNLLVYSFQTKISMGLDPTNPAPPMAFGAYTAVQLKDSAGTVIRESPLKLAGWFGSPGFRQGTLTTPTLFANVTAGETYSLGLVFSVDEAIPPSGRYFLNFFPATGTVYHYTQNSLSP